MHACAKRESERERGERREERGEGGMDGWREAHTQSTIMGSHLAL
jgi:hypothetical protein